MLNGQFQVNGLCPCGRAIRWEKILKAKSDQAGYSVVCPNCHGTISITLSFTEESLDSETWQTAY